MTEHIPAFAICGYSGSGKTTLIEALLPELLQRGLSVAVIKHDAHGPDVDREGKDSDRFFRAGADVFLRGPNEAFGRFHAAGNELQDSLRALAPYYDLFLIEGHKRTPEIPKIWLLDERSDRCPAELANVLGVLGRDDDRFSIVLELFDNWLAEHWRRSPVRAAILIGGRSRRMGQPKHLIEHDGTTWLEQTVRTVSSVVPDVVISGSGAIPDPLRDMRRLHDVEGIAGPAAGMLSAMRWQPAAGWLFVACDTPKLTAPALEWLLESRRPGRWATLPLNPATGKHEMLPGYYDSRCAPLLEKYGRPSGLVGHPKVAHPDIPEAHLQAWTNINTKAELG